MKIKTDPGSFTIVFYKEEQRAYVGAAYDDVNLAHFICDVVNEVIKARKKFPSSMCSMTALMEEVGELAKAYLDEPIENIYKEGVQVACMAARVVLEGDPSIDEYRNSRKEEKMV